MIMRLLKCNEKQTRMARELVEGRATWFILFTEVAINVKGSLFYTSLVSFQTRLAVSGGVTKKCKNLALYSNKQHAEL